MNTMVRHRDSDVDEAIEEGGAVARHLASAVEEMNRLMDSWLQNQQTEPSSDDT